MADIRHHPTTHHSDAFVAADAIHRKRGPTEWPGPFRRDKPVLIPMYAEISQRPPPPRPFSQPPAFSCTPAICAASCERFSDCPPLLSAHFLTPTTGTCQAPQATPAERGATPGDPGDPDGHRPPPSGMGKTRVVVQVVMVLLDDPTAREADHEAARHPLSPRSTASAASTRHRHDQPDPRPRRGRSHPRPIRQRRAGRRRVPASTTISVPPISGCR